MAYQPPLIGYKQLLNFGAYSIPDVGGWMLVAAGVLLFIIVVKETKFLNNKDHDSDYKPGKAGIGLLSQKHLFIMIMFAVWYKEFNMSM